MTTHETTTIDRSILPDGFPTECAGAEQRDYRVKPTADLFRSGYVGARFGRFYRRADSALLTPVCGPIVGEMADDGATLVGESARRHSELERAANAILRLRDGDAQVLDLLNEVVSADGVTTHWAKVIRADAVAHRGTARFRPVSHKYVIDKRGHRVTVVVGRGYAFDGHQRIDWAGDASKRRDVRRKVARQTERAQSGALGKAGPAVTPWSCTERTLRRHVGANVQVKLAADAIEAVLRTSAVGATVPIDDAHRVTFYGATVTTDAGQSYRVREYSQRAALAGVTLQ